MLNQPPQDRRIKPGEAITRVAPSSGAGGGAPKSHGVPSSAEILHGPKRILPPRIVVDTSEKRGEHD
jgi:hypothetical protein